MGSWKTIGCSVPGTSHVLAEKPCEDALNYTIVAALNPVMIGCVCDGAGSAQFGGFAAALCSGYILKALTKVAREEHEINEEVIYEILECAYDALVTEAELQEVELNEYSCTVLGCYITADRALFFQIGDGAIVRSDQSGYYLPVWMPQNGEYQNSTSFLIDDKSFSNLRISIVDEKIDEVALFTDGLQLLALNMEAENVHQPFFAPLFKYLRLADDGDKIAVLQRKLAEYLDSAQINDRTDDDKTLFLATRQVTLQQGNAGILH